MACYHGRPKKSKQKNNIIILKCVIYTHFELSKYLLFELVYFT